MSILGDRPRCHASCTLDRFQVLIHGVYYTLKTSNVHTWCTLRFQGVMSNTQGVMSILGILLDFKVSCFVHLIDFQVFPHYTLKTSNVQGVVFGIIDLYVMFIFIYTG
ncbi:hypothetical protein CEXT_600211 [Caerostris extrusa]|uniref:Uncharacterized protein n=1 Tax=Caerostris extrusa TaxID=172846 RepID=A0AAV4SBL7_CAEEX|nr:hypothetical protein CEXT_600211 [Caerostris extrusa]